MKTLILITKGIIRDVTVRRWVMFVVVLVALLMLFCGATFLNAFLLRRPVCFLVFWGACAWLTLAAMLLAVYDLLILRARGRRERERLRHEVFGKDNRTDL
jgi:hypothetical protein